jgi:hypothetical protein
MLRLVLLALYLAFLYSSDPAKLAGGGWEPNGVTTQPPPGATGDGGGNLDPNG